MHPQIGDCRTNVGQRFTQTGFHVVKNDETQRIVLFTGAGHDGVKHRLRPVRNRFDRCHMPFLSAIQVTEFSHGVGQGLDVADFSLDNELRICRHRQIQRFRPRNCQRFTTQRTCHVELRTIGGHFGGCRHEQLRTHAHGKNNLCGPSRRLIRGDILQQVTAWPYADHQLIGSGY